MRFALTGTPGTGKTTLAKILESSYRVIYLKDFESARVGYDEKRDSYVVDLDYLSTEILKISGNVVVEGHYAHEMPVDAAIVLRCHPDVLHKRLENRGYSKEKIRENVEAEAMGLITAEAIEILGRDSVFEVDTSSISVAQAVEQVKDILAGNGEKYPVRINYMEEILKWF